MCGYMRTEHGLETFTNQTTGFSIPLGRGVDPYGAIFGAALEWIYGKVPKRPPCPDECPRMDLLIHMALTISGLAADPASGVWTFTATCDWTADVYCLGYRERIGGRGKGDENLHPDQCPAMVQFDGQGIGQLVGPGSGAANAEASRLARRDAYRQIKEFIDSVQCPSQCSLKTFTYDIGPAPIINHGPPVTSARCEFTVRVFCTGLDERPAVSGPKKPKGKKKPGKKAKKKATPRKRSR